MDKFHIALSYASEDRNYVEQVANNLRENGVAIFYDKFEDTKLWGKDLYEYLSDIYQNKAIYTIMFVSEAYRDNLWTNHERKYAQARAFTESEEYILPAKFDKSVEIPGLPKTTGYIDLNKLTPIEFSQKVLTKLKDNDVFLSKNIKFDYSIEAKCDVDFPVSRKNKITNIIKNLRSYNWHVQNPAINEMFDLRWNKLTPDQIFVLGRNIYQCACGNANTALGILNNLRGKMASLSLDVAEHLINGMFYEVYFDSKGEFRGRNLKSRCMEQLFEIQTVKKYKNCISFIRKALQPYREDIVIFPNVKPEEIDIIVTVKRADPPVIKNINFLGNEMLIEAKDDKNLDHRMWTLSLKKFSLKTLKTEISKGWAVPIEQIRLKTGRTLPDSIKLSLPEGMVIGCPGAFGK